jgi:uncharacterized protein DUF4349
MASSFLHPRSPSVRRVAAALAHLAALQLVTGCGAAVPAPETPSPGMAMKGESMDAPMAAPPPPPMSAGMPSPPSMAPQSVDAMYDSAPSAPAAAPAARAPGAPSRAPSQPAPARPPPPAKAPPPGKTAAVATGGDKAPPAAERPAGPSAPLLIYVGDMAMLVADETVVPKTIDTIIDLAESLGGYLAGRKDTSVQVRVPSARFRESLTLLEKIGEITHRSVTADDVSEQYSDLEVRLNNLKATQKRLHEFLAKSGTIADMLTVGQQLERVSGEIEAIEGKMRFLRSRAAFSVVTVSLAVKPKQAVIVARTDPPPPPPREIALPIDWLPRVGLDTLLNLR